MATTYRKFQIWNILGTMIIILRKDGRSQTLYKRVELVLNQINITSNRFATVANKLDHSSGYLKYLGSEWIQSLLNASSALFVISD